MRMKTWKQLEAMAKRHGLEVQHDSHAWFMNNDANNDDVEEFHRATLRNAGLP